MKKCFNQLKEFDLPFNLTYFGVRFDHVNIYGNGLLSLGNNLDEYANEMAEKVVITNDFAYLLIPFYTIFNQSLEVEGENWEVIVEEYRSDERYGIYDNLRRLTFW